MDKNKGLSASRCTHPSVPGLRTDNHQIIAAWLHNPTCWNRPDRTRAAQFQIPSVAEPAALPVRLHRS